jgi:hypothetical protein
MKPDRPPLLAALSRELSRSLSRFGRDSQGIILDMAPPFKLRQEADRIALLFEQGAPPEPPLQQRINALARLRRGEADLSRREWILITWGLCDDCGASGKPIEEQPLFDAVMLHTGDWIVRRDVPRKGWFGLLNSYFSYNVDESSQKTNWLRLRGRLAETMPILLGSLSRPKLWSRILEKHRDILTDEAGSSLRHLIFNGSANEREQLKNGLPIPQSSWLWRRVITRQIEHLNAVDDGEFIEALPHLIDFLKLMPLYADDVLAALLTRYCQSVHRAEPHELLKSESFSRWGNPQLRGATRWTMVEQPVRSMVLRWFAKEDLEHFFSLLQGSGQVDKARLVYWLRFVDQISYTRILLGADAMNSQDPEFRNFREKNASRCGSLIGGQSHNNAFVMRIGDQYLVEFSGTGNACYAYHEKELPFDPAAKFLNANYGLKKVLYDRQRHADNRILHMSGWEPKADHFLQNRGIRPGEVAPTAVSKVKNYQAQFSRPHEQPMPPDPAQPTMQVPPQPTRLPIAESANHFPQVGPSVAALTIAPSTQRAINIATELARINQVNIQNNIHKGGVFWVLSTGFNTVLGQELTKLGMTFHPSKGFWIK